jgi:hypothetical protein
LVLLIKKEASVELPWLELVPVCFGKVEPAFSFFVRVWQEYAPYLFYPH